MNPKTLQALLIDRSLGELSPEAEELLEAWLSHDEESRAELARIDEVLAVTGKAVAARPDLFREERLAGEAKPERVPPPTFSHFVRAAAAIAALIVVGVTGFLAGSRTSETGNDLAKPEVGGPARKSPLLASNTAAGPWARYRLAAASDGGLTIEPATPSPAPEESE